MAGNPNIRDIGHETRITPENAKEMQLAGAEAKRAKKTVQQSLEKAVEEGSVEEFVRWAFGHYKSGKTALIALELIKMRDKCEDKQDSRANGELENKVIVYKGMDIEEVK